MSDFDHLYGYDLAVGPTGGIALAGATDTGMERVLRRLLTNRGDYLWHPAYGAGLPARVGEVLDVAKLSTLIRSQMFLERAVQQSPAPAIDLTPIASGVSAAIRYVDAATGATVSTPTFDIDR